MKNYILLFWLPFHSHCQNFNYNFSHLVLYLKFIDYIKLLNPTGYLYSRELCIWFCLMNQKLKLMSLILLLLS